MFKSISGKTKLSSKYLLLEGKTIWGETSVVSRTLGVLVLILSLKLRKSLTVPTLLDGEKKSSWFCYKTWAA